MRVAIMQPYYFPYLGYFRLLKLADVFVVYDCVQFPRRGWVHRNRIDVRSKHKWLTLPIKKQSRDTLIKDLCFNSNAQEKWHSRLNMFSDVLLETNNKPLYERIQRLASTPLEEIVGSINYVSQKLSISCSVIHSSELDIKPSIKGQDRILSICKALGAKEYINAPGGRHLYSPDLFNKHDIGLGFLTDYKGNYQSTLQRLFEEDAEVLKTELECGGNLSIDTTWC